MYDQFSNIKDTALFSREDLPIILEHKWYKDNLGYLTTNLENGEKIRFHRILYPNAEIVDHYDGNKMNNTRQNLQEVSHWLNIAKAKRKENKNGYTGIYQNKNNHWTAHIIIEKEKKNKTYKTKEEAILMRFIWELNYLGKNAPQRDKIIKMYPRLFDACMNGYYIVENPRLVLSILNKVEETKYCPCSIIKDSDHLCMCKDSKELKPGETCHCGIFIKKETED